MRLNRFILPLNIVCLLVVGLFVGLREANAQSIKSPPAYWQETPGVDNEYCLGCHGKPDQKMTLPSGEELYLTVNPDTYYNSVHGKAGYACVQCHTDITSYPHPELIAQTHRELTVSMYGACGRCHQDKYQATQDSVHQKAMQAGNTEAAVCSDCHGSHDVQAIGESRTAIPQTCERCHFEIYQQYKDSVHGEALIGEGNPDVPSCIDCHGVHNVAGPDYNEQFHLKSPDLCKRCHTDEELMAKYGINTNVVNTYLADFHGTTVMFQAEIPGQETNKPVCVDCHGVHNIKSPDNPNSSVMKDNLQKTCQRCHPEAEINFPAAWMSHYVPSPTEYPLVYYVNLFYRILIPTLVGAMGLFVVAESIRRLINRRRKTKHE